MDYADTAGTGHEVEAVAFTSADGAELRAGVSVGGRLSVSLGGGVFRPDPAQAAALGRWLVAAAADYRAGAGAWTLVAGDAPALGEVAGFDTLEHATAVVAGLVGLERARAV